MSYSPKLWQDQIKDALGNIIQAGTPFSAGNMNHLEQGISAAAASSDQANQQIVGMIQKAVNSGLIDFNGLRNGFDNSSSAILGMIQVPSGPSQGINELILSKTKALINGILIDVVNGSFGNGTPTTGLGSGTVSTIMLDSPPIANVIPSLPGSARDDLVFLEVWLDPTTGAPKWRIRVVDGVDFATFPEGFTNLTGGTGSNNFNLNVTPQGGNVSPLIPNGSAVFASNFADYKQRSAYPSSVGNMALTDSGLYTAGDGSSMAQSNLKTLDGFVYAIPLFRVRRRNNSGFDPDNNPLGAIDYTTATENGTTTYAGTSATPGGLSVTLTMTTALPSVFQAGRTLYRVTSNVAVGTITAVSGNQLTFTLLSGLTNFNLFMQQFYVLSDRPDGLYSNIIDSSDITDLRHQVSLTGFNYQALLEKNLDLLLRGQLTTSAGARCGRDYIGLNIAAGMPDDANTLLRCDFNNGSMNGTSNGNAIAATKQGTGTDTFGNGIQGLGWQGSPTHTAGYSYPIAINPIQGAIEMFIKNPWLPNASSNENGLFTVVDGSNNIISYAGLTTDQGLTVSYRKADGTITYFVISTGFLGKSGLSSIDNTWRKIKIEWDANGSYFYLDDTLVYTSAINLFSIGGLTPSSFILGVWNNAATGNTFTGSMDAVRISNIRRSSTLLNNFSFANGDKILDGPGGDFAQWSDDLGGISGINGRTNPYGLSRVPNSLAARVNLNGQEIRHYYANGVTPGYTGSSAGTTSVPGALEGSYGSNEWITVTANESADGLRTSFTFTKPTYAQGIWLIDSALSGTFINGTAVSATIDSTGLITAVFSPAPATTPKMYYVTAQRHAHFIPSTKGFLIHDWSDDTFVADGVATVFQTLKFNVNRINHIRSKVTGSTSQTIQTSGYTVKGYNASTTLVGGASAGATSITLTNVASFYSGQNIQISNGSGGWVSATIQTVSGSGQQTATLTAGLSGAVPSGATIQGAAIVTFTTAPAAGTVDLVYESVYTPSLGDYIRIFYQHMPYQGTVSQDTFTILAETDALVTSLGTGAVNTGLYAVSNSMTAATVNLPTAVADYVLKNDAFIGTTRSTVAAKQVVHSNWDAVPTSSAYPYNEKRIGKVITVSSIFQLIRGIIMGQSTTSSSGPTTLYTEQINAVVPTKTVYAALVKDSNGTLKLLIGVRQQSTNQPQVGLASDGLTALDVFHIQGRPLIKNYGGVAA